jgi:WD40 repeat protein
MNQSISHYRILESIGSGGMGQVWKAEDINLQRTVALKCISPGMIKDQQAKKQATHEARAAAAINHPNIATVYEIGDVDGLFYIAMEYVEGETLSSLIEQRRLSLTEAIEIASQIAEALQAAHSHGLIHCDIKSSNIIVTPERQVKVLDFGLARFVEQSFVPGDGKAIAGSLGYMSPQQIRGEPLDGQTDIFSLGVALFEMLAARRPFDGTSRLSLVQAILNDEPPRIGAFRDDAPLELESILRKALEKSRSQRYRTVDEMLADLTRLKERLENKRTHAVVLDADTMVRDSNNAESVAQGLAENAIDRFLSVLWRYRRWLLVIAVFAALTPIFDLFSNPQRTLTQAIVIGLLLLSCISFIAYTAARRRRIQQVYLHPVAAAFRGLVPLQEADRDRFYGREVDKLALYEKVASSDFRFGVLFGESGSGKTSLVRAGLLPKLWEEGLVPIYCRSYKDPLASVMEECRRRSHLDQREHESPADYLRRVIKKLGGPLIITLDQFEEFFVTFRSKPERAPFISFVAECHDSANLAVKFLVSIRSDFLYLISSEFDGLIPDPLSASRLYYLKNFDEDQAAEIIDSSARKANLPFEPGLSRVIARDLSVSNLVLPSELQIVGERVQSRRIFTAQEYKRAGGKQALVHSFLEEVIQASGDRETCGLLLRSMISDENTRLTLTLEEIAKRTQRNRETIEQILRLLVGARLAREIQDDEPWRYELMHEYLIQKINQITGRVMDATQRANRLLKQYVSSYSVDQRTRIPISKLWFIRRHSDIELAERERGLLKKSLRWGIAKAGGAVLLLAIAAILAAAAVSVNEQWDGVRLSDGHTAAVRRVIFSPDGKLLVSCGEDGRVIVWDFARRERITTLTDHTGWVSALAFSPDGKWFATGSNDQKVIVWDAAQLKKAVILSDHQAPVNALGFSSDGQMLASMSGADEGPMIVWDTSRWDKVYELPKGLLFGDVIFSPDGRHIIIGDEEWNLATASRIKAAYAGTYGAISPDGRRLMGIDGLGTVRFYDLARFWGRAEVKAISERRVHSFHGRTVAFSPDGRLAASGADDIALWDVATQTMLLRFNYSAQVWGIAFSPDGRWLVSGHDDGAVLVWDVAERKQVASFSEHAASVHAVAFSPDGKRLASAGEDRSVIVWDAELGKKEAVLNWHNHRVTAVAFSPDGKWIASTDMDDNLIVWDLTERRLRWANKYGDAAVSYCVTFSPDGRWVVNSSAVYDSADGRQVVDFSSPSEIRRKYDGKIYGIAFSPDGRWMVGVTDLSTVILWDTETWRAVEGTRLSITPVISVSFSSDGKHFVTGDDDGMVQLWEIGPLRQIGVIGQHAARIKSVAFSPDGSEVASASDDKTVALWDVNRRSLITRIGTHTSPVLSVAFSPDGKRIASGEHDKSLHIYTSHRKLWGYRLD